MTTRVSAVTTAATREVPAPTPQPSDEAPEQRVDPDDNKPYTLNSIKQKYRARKEYTDDDIAWYFNNDCQPLGTGTTVTSQGAAAVPPRVAGGATLPPQAPAVKKEEPRVRRFNMSIKEWLLSMDDS